VVSSSLCSKPPTAPPPPPELPEMSTNPSPKAGLKDVNLFNPIDNSCMTDLIPLVVVLIPTYINKQLELKQE